MRFKTVLLAAVLGAVFLGLPSPGECSEAQQHPVTVTLINGKVLFDVFLTVDRNFSTITAKNFVETHVISFHEVRKIEDEDGKDVTAKYLGSYKPPASTPEAYTDTQVPDSGRGIDNEADAGRAEVTEEKTHSDTAWLSEKSEKARQWRGKPWIVRFRAGTLAEIPYGNWFEGLGAGVGFEVAAEIMLTNEASLRATFSHTSLDVERDFLVVPSFEDYRFGDPDLDVSIQKMMLWLVYTNRTSEKFSLFATGGVGATVHDGGGVVPATNLVTGETESVPVSLDETELTFGSGLGVVYWAADHFGIELGADFSAIYGTIEGMDGVSYGYLFSPKLGLTTAF